MADLERGSVDPSSPRSVTALQEPTDSDVEVHPPKQGYGDNVKPDSHPPDPADLLSGEINDEVLDAPLTKTSPKLFTRRVTEVAMLICCWWVIAGIIIVEYKILCRQFPFPFFMTAISNGWAGMLLVVAVRVWKRRILLPISQVEGYYLVALGLVGGCDVAIANLALKKLPIATRQMLGSTMTLFQMFFAWLWGLPPQINGKIVMCGFLLMSGGVLQAQDVSTENLGDETSRRRLFVEHQFSPVVAENMYAPFNAVVGRTSAGSSSFSGALGSSTSQRLLGIAEVHGAVPDAHQLPETAAPDADLKAVEKAKQAAHDDLGQHRYSPAVPLSGVLVQILALILSANRQCLLQYVLQRSPGIKQLDKFSVASRTMLWSSVSAYALARIFEPAATFRALLNEGWLWLKLLVIAALLCLMITSELRLLQLSSTVTFGVLVLLHSIPIVLAGVVFFGDHVGFWECVGFAVCLGASFWYMLIIKGMREREKAEKEKLAASAPQLGLSSVEVRTARGSGAGSVGAPGGAGVKIRSKYAMLDEEVRAGGDATTVGSYRPPGEREVIGNSLEGAGRQEGPPSWGETTSNGGVAEKLWR